MKKTICWVQHASEWQAFIPLARLLEARGYEHVFVCKTKHAYDQYRSAGFKVHFIGGEFFKPPCSSKELARYDATYGPPFISNILESDVHLKELFSNPKEAQSLVGHIYAFWEDFLAHTHVDYIIARETATFLTRPIYAIARAQDIPFGQMTVGTAPGQIILYDVGEYHVWSELVEAMNGGPRPLIASERKMVDAFISSRLPKAIVGMPLRFVPISFFRALKNLLGLWRADTSTAYREDPVHVATLRYGRFRLKKQLEWKYITQYFFQYSNINEEERFVYFPIYSGLETSYLTHSPFWARNEVLLIEAVARNLPQGVFLYVKEHPANPGDLRFKELRALQSIPNVRVLRPEISSQFLIEKSECVFVLEGSVGWEAFLSKKKVLSFGSVPFFHLSKLVYTLSDINELGKAFVDVLAAGNPYKTREDEWYFFIYSVLTTAGKGDVANPLFPYGFISDPALLQSVADYIHETYERRHGKRERLI